MNWWILEDALRDRKGHWLEYLRTFRSGLEDTGDSLRIFASRECEPDVAAALGAEPVLPRSIWARMGDAAPKWKRFLRVFTHGWATYTTVSRILSRKQKAESGKHKTTSPNLQSPTILFVPTVLVHHLLGWYFLLAGKLRRAKTRVVLFFPNTPAYLDDDGTPRWNPDPTAKLFAFLIRRLAKWVRQGQLILGAETEPMVRAMTQLTGVPFLYLPHPVQPLGARSQTRHSNDTMIRFGAYGSARYEKGSELIQEAIRLYLENQPDSRARFSLQWIHDYPLPDGKMVRLDPVLVTHPQCEIINEHFPEGGYEAQIAQTDVVILPYREAYRLRVSRVVIEAMQAGIPTIVAKGTTLHQQAAEHGTLIECEQNNPQSILAAIRYAIANIDPLRAAAADTANSSQTHFSVDTFRRIIAQSTDG